MNDKRKHWFLKYPIVAAFVLPLAVMLGLTIVTSLIVKGLFNVLGERLLAFPECSDLIYSLLRILLAFIIIAVMKITSDRRFKFGFKKKNFGLSFGFASIGLAIAAFNVISCVTADIPLQGSPAGLIVAVIGGLAPGFAEEVICRGVVLTNMLERWQHKNGYILKSVLASGIAFGLVHFMTLPNGDVIGTIQQVCYASALGIFFGAVYARTGNLYGTFIVHSIIDTTSSIFIGELDPTSPVSVSAVVLTIIVFTLIGLYLVRPSKQKEARRLWESTEQA